MENASGMNPGWLTVTEVAKELHVHTNTVRNWSRKGILPTYRLGKRHDRRFRWEDVVRLIERPVDGQTGDFSISLVIPTFILAASAALILNILF